MSVHELVIEADPDDEPQVRLRCYATPDAPCRRRPPDWEGRELWTDEEATETGFKCSFVESVEYGGLESLAYEGDDYLDLTPGVPIDLWWEEQPVWGPEKASAPLPDPEIARLTAEVERLTAELDSARRAYSDASWALNPEGARG